MSYTPLELTIAELIQEADSGNQQAQAELTLEYLRGDKLEQDFEKARHYIYLASKDIVLINLCFKSARETGEPAAYYAIALQWESGLGVPHSFEQCAENLIIAAEKGFPMAMHDLAYKYRHGFGVDDDNHKCEYWHLKALEAGITDSHFNLFLLYYRTELKDNEKAWFHLQESINSKYVHPNAFYFIGDAYYEGKLVSINNLEATKWFLIAQRMHDYTPVNLEKVIQLISKDEFENANLLADEWIKTHNKCN